MTATASNTNYPPDRPTLSSRIDELWNQYADRPAVRYESDQFTWAQIKLMADAISAALGASGLAEATPVAIIMRERPETVAALLCCLRSGRPAILLSPLLDATSLSAEIASAAPATVACADDWDRIGAPGPGTIAVNLHGRIGPVTASGSREPDDTDDHRDLPEGTAVTVLSSGTTGPPKRTPVSHEYLERMLGRPAPPDPDTQVGAVINSLPLVSIGGLLGLITAVWRGRPIALMERFDVHKWTGLIAEYRPQRIGAPPAVLQMVLDASIPREVFESVESFGTGSAPLDLDVAARFEAAYQVAVLQCYGATEFLSAVAGWSLPDWHEFGDQKRGSVGRVMPGFQLRVVDDQRQPVSDNVVGRLEVRTTSDHEDGWVSTNDRARLDGDGFLWILGRLDDVIIRGGFKVPIEEVEAVIRSHHDVAEVAVVGLPDRRLGQVPAAAVVLHDGTADGGDILSYAKGRLAPYKVPVVVRALDALPRNPMMKVLRQEIVEQLTSRLDATGSG